MQNSRYFLEILGIELINFGQYVGDTFVVTVSPLLESSEVGGDLIHVLKLIIRDPRSCCIFTQYIHKLIDQIEFLLEGEVLLRAKSSLCCLCVRVMVLSFYCRQFIGQ